MKKTMMTCSWVLALCLLAPLGGCAEDPDDLTGDTTQALVEDDAQIEGTADGETSPGGALRLPACNQSQLNQAIQHAAIHHVGANVTSCTYNAQTGWIYYTYSYPPPDPCPLYPCPWLLF
ncbi:MAG: hypothetical protein KBG48_20095 [Kofleriaceae bacterium]|jgi:hypothetical protein|nr:hypothetical protein [Kofleriaceae bacterium]MBP9169715.1 hypothetical protein [Kofleriaceae bacterium]MBP9858131.1 hypothetical protein [Kofleriaceae bacterium]